MINNRQQSGRRRGRGGQGGQRQGGGAPGRPDGGNRIDSRARGNANQLHEKYKNLASEAQRQGDRVNTEYYLQFADHYFRVLSENRPRFEEQQRGRGRDDQFGDDSDTGDQEEYGDEGEQFRPGEQMAQPRRAERQAGDDGERRRFEERRPRRDHEEGERLNGRPRPEPRVEFQAPVEAQAAEPDLPLPEPEAEAPQPRRRGRPRKVEAAGPEAPAAFDADRLPPALGAPANDSDESGEPKPRRRRARAAVEAPAAE